MNFGVWIPNCRHLATPAIIRGTAVRAEQLGYDSVWVSDHVVVPHDNVVNFGETVYDPLVTLGVLAGATQRVQLGTTVLIVPYRNAVVTAKMVSSLDALSGRSPMAELSAAAPAGVAASERDVLLATKLHVPRLQRGFVPRLRLVDALDEGLARRLILVCGPAGSGKTAALFASGFVVCFPPLVVLGMYSPLSVRLILGDPADAGKISGGLFAISSLGNIVGIIVTTFLLIPTIGTRAITLGFATFLVLSGLASAAAGVMRK
jgi:hypothetical protein